MVTHVKEGSMDVSISISTVRYKTLSKKYLSFNQTTFLK